MEIIHFGLPCSLLTEMNKGHFALDYPCNLKWS